MKNKILFVFYILFGLMMINAGLNKFLHYMPMPENMPESMVKVMNAFTDIGWLLPLTGVIEIVGGVLFIIPKYRALGALVIFPVMIGIVLTNIFNDQSGLPMALVLLLINLYAMYDNRMKYKSLLE